MHVYVEFQARLGADAEVLVSKAGKRFIRFRAAAQIREQDVDGNWVNQPRWFECKKTINTPSDENQVQILKKGREFYIRGKLYSEIYKDKICDTCFFDTAEPTLTNFNHSYSQTQDVENNQGAAVYYQQQTQPTVQTSPEYVANPFTGTNYGQN